MGDATNLLEDQWILVRVDGDFERVQITDKTGNALTVNPPLSDSPDTPGEVRSGRQLIKNSLLNDGHVGNATIAELETADMSVAPAGVKAFVQERGIYRWAPGDSSTPDGESVVENADGRFLLEVGTNNPGPGGLAELVQSLLLRVQALETAQFVTQGTARGDRSPWYEGWGHEPCLFSYLSLRRIWYQYGQLGDRFTAGHRSGV